jgi:hypothetical protein
MKPGIEETDKSYVFYRLIGKRPVKVTLRTGWIWIEEEMHAPTWYNPFRKIKGIVTYTTEDARNLIACLEQLIPKQEGGKSPATFQG